MTDSRIVVALDHMTHARAQTLARALSGHVWGFKVHGLLDGSRSPRDLIFMLKSYGRVFVDIKAHDTDDTVAWRVGEHAKNGADLVSIHASVGPKILRKAVDAFETYRNADALGLLAITVLTTLSPEECFEIYMVEKDILIAHWLEFAIHAGAWGLVSGVPDIPNIRDRLTSSRIQSVTPGIRLPGAATHDQKRVATPEEAVANGAALLVVGRPITGDDDPVAAAIKFNERCELAA